MKRFGLALAAKTTRSSIFQSLPPFGSFFIPFLLYLATACRDIYWTDATELMLCGRLFCMAHPPGYPLLTLLLRVLSFIPLLSMPFRMNLFSSLAAAGSCLFTYLTLVRLTNNRWAGLFTALAWGFSFELWNQATALEVYALNAFLLSVCVYAVTTWAVPGIVHSRPMPAATSGDSTRGSTSSALGLLTLAAFTFGLGMANHLTILFWLPGLLLLTTMHPTFRLGRVQILTLLLLLLVGPFLYATLPFLSRPDQLGGWGGVDSLSDWYEFVTSRTYRYRLEGGVPGYFANQLSLLPGLLAKQFLASWLFLFPGIYCCFKENKRLCLALVLSFVFCTGFALAYNIPDKEGFFLPAYFALVLLIGLGFAYINRRKRKWLLAAGFALHLLPLILHYPVHNRRHLHGLRDLSSSLLREIPAGSILFTDEYSTTQGLRWLFTEQDREQFLLVNEHLLAFPWYLEALSKRAVVPEPAFALARRLWQSQATGARFGELAKNTTQEVKFLLVQEWITTRPIFWMPADFQSWPESWHEFRLQMQGLTYRLLPASAADSLYIPSNFTFPGPERYNTRLFREKESQDLCRRFAAAANRRGILYFRVGDHAKALADFNLSLRYFPEYASAIENKGIVFFYAEQPDSARHYLQAYLNTAPDAQEATKVRMFLEKLGR